MRADTTFTELLAATRETALGAFAHQRINLDRVVREINPDRRHGAERMTRVSFGFREPDGGGFTLPGIRCERADLRSHVTQLPLGLMVEFTGTGALIEAEHLVEVLAPALVAQLLDHFVVLLESALAQPDTPLCRLDLIDPDGLRWLHEVSAGERFDTEPATLAGLIEAQVARTPDAVAVVYEGHRHTYAEVNAAANRVAHRLIASGIGAEDRVAVLLDKVGGSSLAFRIVGDDAAGTRYFEGKLISVLTDFATRRSSGEKLLRLDPLGLRKKLPRKKIRMPNQLLR